MRGGRSSDTSVNKLLTEWHAESPMSLSSSPKSKIIKAGNELNDYGSNFKTKIALTFILKENSFSKSRSLVFTFDSKKEVDSSSFLY